MLSGQQAVNEVFTLLKEPFDPLAVKDLSRWTRAEILQRLNLAQDRLALIIVDLFGVQDTSLSTVAGQMEYAVPSQVGKIKQVSIAGYQLQATTLEQIKLDSVRGEEGMYWATITDQPEYFYYDQARGVLGFWPVPASTGLNVLIDGELVFSLLTDSSSIYLLQNYQALRKGQQAVLYFVAAMCAAENNNALLLNFFLNEAEKITEDLKVYWTVLTPSTGGSTIQVHESEDADSSVVLPPRYVR
jgi:hypothetical protein